MDVNTELEREFAQVRKMLDPATRPLWEGVGPKPEHHALDALSSIERHVQDMEKALRAVLEDPLGSHGARAVAREALGIPFTPRANWGPDHPSYDEMGQ